MGAFLNRRACSETLFCVLERALEHPNSPPERSLEERACSVLAGGFMARGYQCGAIWGAVLSAGARVHQRCGATSEAEITSIIAAERLVKTFRQRNPSLNCADLTVPNLEHAGMRYFILKGGMVRCLRRAADFAPDAYADIAQLPQLPEGEVPDGNACLSCSAQVAKGAGASAQHAVMVAGFAGGIGLSGGGCGALGAALWILAMRVIEAGLAENVWRSTQVRAQIEALIESFLSCSGNEFECCHIAGRRFLSPRDHAAHLDAGGCEDIIRTLARQCAS
jgi:hypothetical protein